MNEVMKELYDLAGRIRGYQEERKINDSEMLRRFPGLGSTKTYVRIVQGDLEELDCARWLRDYSAMWNVIQTLEEAEAEDDPIYDDLTTVLDVRGAVADAMREKGNNRLVLVQGPSGSGKSTAALLLQAKFGARVLICEATEMWKDNPNAMLSQLLGRLGVDVDSQPASAADKFARLIEKLCESRVCLIIDEAHHLGPRTLNLVKSIINQTPGEVVLLTIETLWARLETKAYAEARQLTRNRLSERVRFEGLEVSDVEKMLERRLGLNGQSRQTAQALVRDARDRGNMAFVKLSCRKARKLAGKGEVTVEHVAKAAAQVAAMR